MCFQEIYDNEVIYRPVCCEMFADIQKYTKYQWKSIDFDADKYKI